MTKTPEQMAEEYVWETKGSVTDAAIWLDGYKVGFEIGCMKGSMAMQSTLDGDYHLTPIIDHKKLANRLTKREVGDE